MTMSIVSKMKWIVAFSIRNSPTGKTKVFQIQSKDGQVVLGQVKWYGPWRKYCFYPEGQTIFEWDCLRDIAEFCEKTSRQHGVDLRAAKAIAKNNSYYG